MGSNSTTGMIRVRSPSSVMVLKLSTHFPLKTDGVATMLRFVASTRALAITFCTLHCPGRSARCEAWDVDP